MSDEEAQLPSEEEEFEPSDEEEAPLRRGGGGPSGRDGRGKRNSLIDDAAEESGDDEDERRRTKRSRFIDDIAEVDEEEEEDDDEDGVDDLIDDGGVEDGRIVADATDAAEMRRQMREAEIAAARDAELSPEDLQRYLSERYGGARGSGYAGAASLEGDGGDDAAVVQQALLPTAADPKLWVVRCAEGAERELVVSLLQKAYDRGARGRPLAIRSAFCLDHLKGFVYVEATKGAHVTEAVEGMRSVFHSKAPSMVPLGEMTAALAPKRGGRRGLAPGAWARVRAGVYKGDLAQVQDVDPGGARVTVRLVPRLDYEALRERALGADAKPSEAGAGVGARGAARKRASAALRPAPRRFSPAEAGSHGLDVQAVRDRTTGRQVHVLNGNLRFVDGFLVRTCAARSIVLEEGVPPLDELARFSASDAAGAAGGGGGGDDLAALVQSARLGAAGDGAGASETRAALASRKFLRGDRVVVTKGDLKGIKGVVDRTEARGAVWVTPADAALPGFNEAIEFAPDELARRVEEGDRVRIGAGANAGETGLVVAIDGPLATVFTDVTRSEVRALAADLEDASGAVPAAAAASVAGAELHDLVALDPGTVGVVVAIDGDVARVLTNQGRPDRPDIRPARAADIARKIATDRRAAATDGAGDEVRAGDALEIVDGPLRGRSGTVRHVARGALFIQCRDVPENGGFVCVAARHCRVRGGTGAPGAAAAGPGGLASLATPARLGGFGGAGAGAGRPGAPFGVPQSPARGGGAVGGPGGAGYGGRQSAHHDRVLEGKVVTVKQGPYRGMRGRIVSATPTHLRMELEAQMKTVTVSRQHVSGLGGPAEAPGGAYGAAGSSAGYGRYGGSGANTSSLSGGASWAAGGHAAATPLHPGVGATPLRYSGATPLHPGFTPATGGSASYGATPSALRTPAHDPAWAATPAHPGFGATYTPEDDPPAASAPTPRDPYAAPTPRDAYAAPTPRDPYAAPTPRDPYAAPTPRDAYAAPTPRDPYAAPTPRDPYAAPTPRDPYAAPTPRDPYAAPTPRDPYAAPTPRDPYAASTAWGAGTAEPTGRHPAPPPPAWTPTVAPTPATPGLLAPTPGIAAPTGGGAGGAAPAAGGTPVLVGRDPAHWVGIEVVLPRGRGRGVVTSCESSVAQVLVGEQEPGGSSWTFPESGGETLEIELADLEAAPPLKRDRVRKLAGDLAGSQGELVGTDGGDGIVKADDGSILIWDLALVGKVVG